MIYKNFQGLKLSALGMGCMRLPIVNGNDQIVDETVTAQMVAYAMEHGINYYDTAWGYHGGHSETVMGKILQKYPQDSFYLASKFPGYDLSNIDKAEEIFEKQLEKCRVEYFDFYLFHNVCETNIDAYLDSRHGLLNYLKKQKEDGRIRHLGFSAHGSYDVMKRFLEAYGAHMEFCQIQLNYLDWSLQEAGRKVELLKEYHTPVWVMEPLRGGRLAALPDAETRVLKALRPDEAIPAWAFRFLQTIPEVTMVLSGMSNPEQLQDNIHTYETEQPLNDQEWNTLLNAAESIRGGVPCTACHYCTNHCPQEIDIPTIIRLYNDLVFSGESFTVPRVVKALPKDKQPSACVGCKSCEKVCPQQIKVPDIMTDFVKMLK